MGGHESQRIEMDNGGKVGQKVQASSYSNKQVLGV